MLELEGILESRGSNMWVTCIKHVLKITRALKLLQRLQEAIHALSTPCRPGI